MNEDQKVKDMVEYYLQQNKLIPLLRAMGQVFNDRAHRALRERDYQSAMDWRALGDAVLRTTTESPAVRRLTARGTGGAG